MLLRPAPPPRRGRPARRLCACQLGVLYRAFNVPSLAPPYDSVQLRLLFPSSPPPAGPSPVVILLGAANTPATAYTWLAERLVAAGYAVAQPTCLARYGPTAVLLPLPYDVAALASWPAYKEGPAAEGFALLLAELKKLNEEQGGPLHRELDLSAVAVGGHATGGRAALELVAYGGQAGLGVGAAFAYGATLDNEPRRAALERPGCGEVPLLRPFGTYTPPLLLLGGEQDASLAEGPSPGGQLPDCAAGLRRVLWQGVEGRDDAAEETAGGTTGGALLAVLAGGAFSTPCFPVDAAAAAQDEDLVTADDPGCIAHQTRLRDALGNLIERFLDASLAPPGWLPPGPVPGMGPAPAAVTGLPLAEGLGPSWYGSRAERALAWPPAQEECPLVVELMYSPPAAGALAAFADPKE